MLDPNMIEHLKEMAKAISLEAAYDWKLPADVPIEIPAGITGSFSKNVYLKENLAPVLEQDNTLIAIIGLSATGAESAHLRLRPQ